MKTHDERMHQAKEYISRIRNEDKRRYASKLLAWNLMLLNDEPERGNLSAMGAQAVRHNLREILDPK